MKAMENHRIVVDDQHQWRILILDIGDACHLLPS
jgi:hypothetical protein